jgi:GNAT superfamily N-acetyltransferase
MMVPLDPAAARYVRAWLGPPNGPGLLALHHALTFHRPGLWGSEPGSPRSVILVREGLSGLEAFGAGQPEPVIAWLVGRRREFTLHAPDKWHELVRERLGAVDVDCVETWIRPGLTGPFTTKTRRTTSTLETTSPTLTRTPTPTSSSAATVATQEPATRRLTEADAGAVVAMIPPWAFRGWRSYPALIEHGAVFGVPFGQGFAAVAWVFDRAENFEALSVFTVPRFRRLGLGYSVAAALIRHVVLDRGHIPLWSTPADNEPSRALARALGFSVAAEETLLRWPTRNTTES